VGEPHGFVREHSFKFDMLQNSTVWIIFITTAFFVVRE